MAARQARLIAQWMNVGFIHGVMNTDNMTISGETIDYGPCAFMEAYDPATVFSSIDHGGRYAYGNQPPIARWNLARLAETLLPLLAEADDEAAVQQAVAEVTAVIDDFPALYAQALLQGQRAKLGLHAGRRRPRRQRAGRRTGWRCCSSTAWISRSPGAAWPTRPAATPTPCARCSPKPRRVEPLAGALARALRAGRRRRQRRRPGARRRMRLVNPWIIPRNHRVEEALAAAIGRRHEPLRAACWRRCGGPMTRTRRWRPMRSRHRRR